MLVSSYKSILSFVIELYGNPKSQKHPETVQKRLKKMTMVTSIPYKNMLICS